MANSPDNAAAQRKLVIGLFVALAAWAIYLAIGAYLFNRNPWQSLMTIACMAVFLGLWCVALLVRKSRIAASRRSSDGTDP